MRAILLVAALAAAASHGSFLSPVLVADQVISKDNIVRNEDVALLGMDQIREEPAKAKTNIWCQLIAGMILAGWVAPCFSMQLIGNVLGFVGSVMGMCYVFGGGVWSDWQAGASVGGWCLFVMIMAILDLTRLCCVCFCVTTLFAAMVMNPAVVQMAAATSNLTPEQKAYFASDEFDEKCMQLFLAAGGVRGGSLNTHNLRQGVLSQLPPADQQKLQRDPLFVMAFDTNKDEQLDFAHFKQVMVYIVVCSGNIPKEKPAYQKESHVTVEEVED